jgi:predicted nucleic acid-binding protein
VIVVDVNVLAYLFIDGPQTAEVLALRDGDPEWAAPLLWRSEWRSIMAGYLRRGDLDRALAIRMTETATRMLRGREYPVEHEAVLDVVLGSTLSAYDAEYVATASRLGVPLYTYDREVLDAFPEVARRP